jgi:hypothetical protein
MAREPPESAEEGERGMHRGEHVGKEREPEARRLGRENIFLG